MASHVGGSWGLAGGATKQSLFPSWPEGSPHPTNSKVLRGGRFVTFHDAGKSGRVAGHKELQLLVQVAGGEVDVPGADPFGGDTPRKKSGGTHTKKRLSPVSTHQHPPQHPCGLHKKQQRGDCVPHVHLGPPSDVTLRCFGDTPASPQAQADAPTGRRAPCAVTHGSTGSAKTQNPGPRARLVRAGN